MFFDYFLHSSTPFLYTNDVAYLQIMLGSIKFKSKHRSPLLQAPLSLPLSSKLFSIFIPFPLLKKCAPKRPSSAGDLQSRNVGRSYSAAH